MADRQENSRVIVLGKETISGSKSTSGVYKNPKAEVEIYNKNLKINLEKDITKLILKIRWEYVEATTKKDLPNFLFLLKQDGKEFAKSFWSDPDIFYKFENQNGELIIEIDLEKFYSAEEKTKLQLVAHLECWLEEQPWRGGTPQKTASASGDTDLEINLPKIQEPGASPEISLDIFPTHSPGKDLKNYINADWGNQYFVRLHLDNKSNNILTSGAFTLFENNKNIKDANLKKELESKWKTIIISEDNATWVLIKDKKDFEWYRDAGSGKFKLNNKTNRTYEYYSNGRTIDEFGFAFDLESNKVSVNVRVPDYKINAMNTYNLVVDVQTWLNGSTAVSFAALYPPLLVPATIAGAALLITSLVTSGEFESTKNHFKEIMDDPPQFDKNYKRLFKFKVPTKKAPKLIFLHNKISKLSEAIIITSNRLYSAKMRKDTKVIKKQTLTKQNYSHEFKKSLRATGKILSSLGRTLSDFEGKLKEKQIKDILRFIKSKEFPKQLVRCAKEYGIKNITYKTAKQLQKISKQNKKFAHTLTKLGESYKLLAGSIK